MVIKDQAYYYEFLNDKLNYDSIRKLKIALNKENISNLKRIIHEIGWPKKSELGNVPSLAAFLTLQHSPIEFQKKYFTIFEDV